MMWFNIAFAHVMILTPIAVVFLVPVQRKSQAIDLPRARQLTVVLAVLTAAVLGIWWWVFARSSGAWWPGPGIVTLSAFFGLHFGMTMPILRLKNPDWTGAPPHDLPTRGASLQPRSDAGPGPRWGLRTMWLGWAIALLTILLLVDWRVLVAADETLALRSRMGWAAVIAMAGLVMVPALMQLAVRADRGEPQPLDQAGSAELQSLYARRRRQRAWLFVGMGWAMLTLFAAFCVGMALMNRGSVDPQSANTILAWGGVVGGTTVGLLGGILGTLSGIQQARINRRLRELTQQAEAAGPAGAAM